MTIHSRKTLCSLSFWSRSMSSIASRISNLAFRISTRSLISKYSKIFSYRAHKASLASCHVQCTNESQKEETRCQRASWSGEEPGEREPPYPEEVRRVEHSGQEIDGALLKKHFANQLMDLSGRRSRERERVREGSKEERKRRAGRRRMEEWAHLFVRSTDPERARDLGISINLSANSLWILLS